MDYRFFDKLYRGEDCCFKTKDNQHVWKDTEDKRLKECSECGAFLIVHDPPTKDADE